MSVTLSDTPVLQTERLILRAPEGGDWPAFRDFILDARSVFVRSSDLTEGQAWRGFGHVIGHWVMRGWGSFVLCDRTDGAPLGMAGPWFPAEWPEPELGWSLWSPEAEGRGLAREAVLAARRFAFGPLGWDTAVSYVDPANTRSAALARRLGCTLDADAAFPGQGPLQVWRHPAGGAA